MKRFLEAVAILALVLSVPVGLIGVGNVIAARAEKRAREEWNRDFEPVEAFKARFGRRTKNASAFQLETLAIPLGVNMRPATETPPAVPDHSPQSLDTANLRELLTNYLNREIERENGEVSDPPVEVATFINAHIDPLLAIENYINHADLPAWTFDSEHVLRTPLPNLTGYIKLARLLSVHAVVAQKGGRAGEAWEAMHAVSRLAQSLDNQPLLTAQLMSLAISKYEAAFARKLQAPAPAWQEEFSHRDFQVPLLDGFVGEQFHATERLLETRVSDDSNEVDGLFHHILVGPYLRMCAADVSSAQAGILAEVKKKNICDLDLARIDSEGATRLAGRRQWLSVLIPSYSGPLERLRNLILGQELTAKVLQAKSARGASRAWPAAIAGIEKSRCSGRSWNYRVASDGTMTLALDKPFARPNKESSVTILPLNYSEK